MESYVRKQRQLVGQRKGIKYELMEQLKKITKVSGWAD